MIPPMASLTYRFVGVNTFSGLLASDDITITLASVSSAILSQASKMQLDKQERLRNFEPQAHEAVHSTAYALMFVSNFQSIVQATVQSTVHSRVQRLQ